MELSAFLTVEDVANFYQSEIGVATRRYDDLVNIIIRGYIQLNNFANLPMSMREVQLTTNDAGKVSYPDSAIKIIDVGRNTNGRFYAASKDPDMIIPYQLQDGVEVTTGALGIPDVIPKIFRISSLVPFTYAGYNNLRYKLDESNRIISVNGFPDNYVWIRYQSTNISVTDDNLIPILALEALLSFAKWKLENDQNAMVLFNIESNKFKTSTHRISENDWIDMSGHLRYYGAKI